MGTDLTGFLQENNFFIMSSALAEELIAAIELAKRESLAKEDIEPLSEDDMELLANPEMIAMMVALDEEGEITDGDIQTFQKRCAREMYFHLGFLSRLKNADALQNTSVEEILNFEFQMQWGLNPDHALVLKHTQEFLNWLIGIAKFKTGWGRIEVWDNNTLVLVNSERPGVMVPCKLFKKGDQVQS